MPTDCRSEIVRTLNGLVKEILAEVTSNAIVANSDTLCWDWEWSHTNKAFLMQSTLSHQQLQEKRFFLCEQENRENTSHLTGAAAVFAGTPPVPASGSPNSFVRTTVTMTGPTEEDWPNFVTTSRLDVWKATSTSLRQNLLSREHKDFRSENGTFSHQQHAQQIWHIQPLLHCVPNQDKSLFLFHPTIFCALFSPLQHTFDTMRIIRRKEIAAAGSVLHSSLPVRSHWNVSQPCGFLQQGSEHA